ncbi:fibronectin type III domain-containing protein [uncultured Jatrophihabitans sp.]|uniref:fibronectin type III domain-containing protein n=1 Tax=uncultured Jatrophihabitans sp. TaxID=1610747 RepID=UPI0035CC37B7
MKRSRLFTIPRGATAVLTCLALALSGAAATLTTENTSSVVPGSPYGGINSMRVVPGGVQVIGWDIDPSAQTSPVATYGTVDHANGVRVTANGNRPDVARVYKHAGAAHGFNFVIPATEGKHVLCVGAFNIGAGARRTLKCLTMTLDYGPFGGFNPVTNRPGALDVRGWAIDRDAPTSPVTMSISIDGTPHTVVANRTRTDVARVYPGTGTAHGFDVVLPTSQGAHRICGTAVNIGYGSNNSYGCRTAVLDNSPLLAFGSATRSRNQIRVTGWAIDEDAPTRAVTVTETVDGRPSSFAANTSRPDVGRVYPNTGTHHGFDHSVTVAEGTHTVCVRAANIGYGVDAVLPCKTVVMNYTPTASIGTPSATATGMRVVGWSVDPDTAAPTAVRISVDGRGAGTTMANHTGVHAAHRGHYLTVGVRSVSGRHAVCLVAVNELYGTHDSPASCTTTTLALRPVADVNSLTRVAHSTAIAVRGWAFDPDTAAPLKIGVTVDGVARPDLTAAATRTDVARAYPGTSAEHGFTASLAATDGEHRVCLMARNVGGGSDLTFACRIINAVHPRAASVPLSAHGTPGYGAVTVTWTAPVSDGGAPVSRYIVRTSNGTVINAAATARSATVTGLKSSTSYLFSVEAVNVAGSSARAGTGLVKTLTGPAPQRSPAPVSISRYIRNIRGSSPSELATMRAEGLADARRNPSGHSYVVLLDIGGQDQSDGGVVLSAGVRFVSYGNLVRDVEAYTDGYHQGQRGVAPVVIALGTNNDMDVSYSSGAAWATRVVNPVRSHAHSYGGMSVAGANDIEPGFRASYSATRSWLSGYLASTSATFVFNGSADGCAWTATGRRCNNGWTMAGLYTLATGAAPTRSWNLPQIYNTTMAAQWKYISLTGVVSRQARIRFGGTLTELTACRQAHSCGSLSGGSAWSTLWRDLQSDSRVRVSSLPWATDLRIDS